MSSSLVPWIEGSTEHKSFAMNSMLETLGLPVGTKWSFITRNVPTNIVSHAELMTDRSPEPGDLVLARIDKVAQHTRIQLRNGRRSLLYPGDYVIVAYGNRYAPDQFEAEVPDKLDACHLVAAGGIAARAVSKHVRLKWPTSLRPEGFCVDTEGNPVNLRDFSIPRSQPSGKRKPLIAVLGTSMNSGKTTTVAALVKGLTAAGYRTAAIKATGTGAGNDLWAYEDAGAHSTLDFTDAGYPSTYKLTHVEIQDCFNRLISTANEDPGIDMIVVEIADGLLHGETSELVGSETYKHQVNHTFFAAGEAMGAMAGITQLDALGVTTTALSGLLSASQLASAEAERVTGIPVFTKATLQTPEIAKVLF